MDDLSEALDSLFSHDEFPQVRENYVKAPFAWPGGKSRSVEKIIPHLPIRKSYIEPFGGSGAVLLARDESELEVFNDRFSGITDFYKVIHDPASRDLFIERCFLTPHSRELFIYYKDTWKDIRDPVERAARWYYMLHFSFASQGRNFGRSTSGTNILANKWESRIPLITAVSKRLARVLIENQDAFQILNDFDDADSVFYLDPPYYEYNQGIYEHELKRDDHIRLINRIMDMKGFVAISGYENPLYDKYDWTDRVEWEVYSTAGSQAFTKENNLEGKEHLIKRGSQKEVLWIKESQ